MKQYKAGDKIVYKSEQIYPEVFEVTGFDEFDWMKTSALVAGYDFPKNFSEKPPYEHVRLATKEEAEAGFREGSKGFNLYWYGQSEADALKEHLALQDELVEGVMTVKPSETKCGNLFCSEPSETLLCSKCRAKVKGIAMTEEQLKAFQKAYRKATMIDLTAIHGIHFAPEQNCYLSDDGNHKRVSMINGGLWMWQELQPVIDFSNRMANLDKAKLEILNAQIEDFKQQATMLRSAAKSFVYNEREKNILLSQADDVEKILGKSTSKPLANDPQDTLNLVIKLLPSLKAENELHGCDQVERQIELLEEALKGGSHEKQ